MTKSEALFEANMKASEMFEKTLEIDSKKVAEIQINNAFLSILFYFFNLLQKKNFIFY